MITFKQFVKKAFDTSDMFRAEFAQKIGVSKPTLDNYLSGRTQPSFDEGCRIIKSVGFFDVQITVALDNDDFFNNNLIKQNE